MKASNPKIPDFSELNPMKKTAKVRPIPECETCNDIADRAFEAGPVELGDILLSFLNHVVHEHTGELLTLLAEKYGPIFMTKRALR